MATVKDIYNFIDSFAPFDTQEEWDNSGLLVGEHEQSISKVLVALDVNAELVEEAKQKQCDLIVTHHPIIFHPIDSFTEKNPAFLAAKYNISVISVHTPLDRADGGVNAVLAELLGLKNVRTSKDFFRIGEIEPMSVRELAVTVKAALNADIRFSMAEKQVKTVAVCGGSASELIESASNEGADVFVTGDIKHHEILDANDLNIAVIAAGHFETEAPAMKALVKRMKEAFSDIRFVLSEQTSPIQYF